MKVNILGMTITYIGQLSNQTDAVWGSGKLIFKHNYS
jgi:hypothetical protein